MMTPSKFDEEDILKNDDEMPDFEVEDCESTSNKSKNEMNETTAATEGEKSPWDEKFFAKLDERLREVIKTYLARVRT